MGAASAYYVNTTGGVFFQMLAVVYGGGLLR